MHFVAPVDLAQDYVDLAASYQGLGYLESGITEPLNRFAERMLDFSGLLKSLVRRCIIKSLMDPQANPVVVLIRTMTRSIRF